MQFSGYTYQGWGLFRKSVIAHLSLRYCHSTLSLRLIMSYCHSTLRLRLRVSYCHTKLSLRLKVSYCHGTLSLRLRMSYCHSTLSLRIKVSYCHSKLSDISCLSVDFYIFNFLRTTVGILMKLMNPVGIPLSLSLSEGRHRLKKVSGSGCYIRMCSSEKNFSFHLCF